jgi:hypothetical protein
MRYIIEKEELLTIFGPNEKSYSISDFVSSLFWSSNKIDIYTRKKLT